MTETVPETTFDLVERTRAGDERARERLIRRYLPILTRWAHGRLAPSARDLNETADLVQVTLMRALQNLAHFEVRGGGAFFGYLRQVMTNILRDEMRRVGRRPPHESVSEELPEPSPSPLAATLTVETLRAYETGLHALDADGRDLVVMRVELGLTHDEIASITGAPSANTSRMRVARALARLAQLMAAADAAPAVD